MDKTALMLFGKNNNQVDIEITLGGVTIPRVHTTKFLGVWLDDKLNWSTHVAVVRKKLQSRQRLLARSKNFLNTHCLRMLYFAQIQSVLSYGIVVWGTLIKECDLNTLQKIQNKCLCCIVQKESIPDILKETRILPVCKIVNLEQAKLGFKLCNDMLPTTLSNALLTNHTSASIEKNHRYNTRHKKIPNLPPAQTKQYRDSFLYKAISAYSTLPTRLQQLKDIYSFNSECKKYLQST